MASEYGGGVRAIMDGVYIDELIYLTEVIEKRKADNIYMQAIIATVPYMEKEDRKRFFKNLSSKRGKDNNNFDESGFSALKMAMSQGRKFIVK